MTDAKLVPVSRKDTTQKNLAALVVGARLLEALDKSDISQRELARRLAGKSATREQAEAMRRNISRWCAGETKPNAKNAGRLARELGTPADHFRVGAPEAANVIAALEDRVAKLEADRSLTAQPGRRGQRGGGL